MTGPTDPARPSGTDLAAYPLFAPLDDDVRAGLAERLSAHFVRRGQVVFVENEPGDTVLLVLEGKVKIARHTADGRESVLAVLGPGDLFGELSLFDPGPRTATASAVVDSRLASLAHADLEHWLETRPDVGRLLLRVLARRLRRTNDALSDLIFTDVPGRVAKALLQLADQFGTATADGILVEHALTQEELAQLVGASRETVNKALADFVARGWILLETRAVLLKDRDRLVRRAR